jgi:serine/threonine-protein kinase
MDRPRSDAESIVLAALQHTDPARRAAFVASACGGDDDLRRTVEARLRSHGASEPVVGPQTPPSKARTGGTTEGDGPRIPVSNTLARTACAFGDRSSVSLRDPVDGPDPPVTGPPSEGTGLPREGFARYQFYGEIARGGMGSILKGHDAELNRDLAFKILRDDLSDDEVMVRRFVEEAQIAGQLQHPGIVPVYDLGRLADRRPFFAMKLVKGRTLGELLKERSDPRDDRPRLLGIFEQVCQTAAYAHSRGVIHRDLKPSNVMVGSFGEVQVMDWGLAKVLTRGGGADHAPTRRPSVHRTVIATARSDSVDSDLTGAGAVMGTPGYMAPEQARGEVDRVDERVDVFALGSILCQILTGQPTFLGGSVREIHERASKGELTDAWDRLDACEADAELIAIAKACLAPQPADRPRHAGAVAERVTAYLGGVQERLRGAEVARAAEEARAEQAIHTAAEANERARVERRARRSQVGLAAALLLLVTAGGMTFTYWLHQSHLSAARFDRLLAEARTIRDRARREPGEPALWREALAALDRAEGQGPDTPIEALRAEFRSGLDEAERVANDARRVADEAQRVAREAERVARLRHDVVEIRANRAEVGPDGTDAAYAAAFRAADLDLDALEPTEFARRLRLRGEAVAIELSAFLDDWSAARHAAKRPVAAWRKPLEAARRADPEPYRDRLREVLLAEDRKPRVEVLKALAAAPEAAGLPAGTAVLLGRTLVGLGQVEVAVALLRTAAVRQPGDVWVNYFLADALERVHPPAREEAVRYFTAARALRPDTAHELAGLLDRMGRGDEAEVVFRDLTSRRPDNPRHLAGLGIHLLKSRRPDEAAPFLERAAVGFRKAIALHPDLAGLHYQLGNVLRAQKALDEAAAEYRIAIRLNPDYAEAHCNLGMVLRSQHDYAGSLAMLRRGHELGSKQPGWSYDSAQWVAEAERLAKAAAKRPESRKNEDRLKFIAHRRALAQMYSDIKRHAAAAAFWAEVLAADPELGDDRKAQVRYHAASAAALAAAGRGTDAPKDVAARSKLRAQALAWLEAERDAWADVLDSGDAQARPVARQALQHWRADPDLAGVRDSDALAKLPERERAAWRALWVEVDRLLKSPTAAPGRTSRGADKDGIGDAP